MTWNPWRLRQETAALRDELAAVRTAPFPRLVFGPTYTGVGQLLGWKAAATPGVVLACCAQKMVTVEAQMNAVASVLSGVVARRRSRPAEIVLENGSVIIGRVAGVDNQGVKGLHCDIAWWGEDCEAPVDLVELARPRKDIVFARSVRPFRY